jgi:hypothetical protein
MQAARADGMNPLPVESRHGSTWLTVLRKENNSIVVVLHETREDDILVITPENQGIQPYLFYGPNMEIKMRCANLGIVKTYLETLCPGVTCTERLITKEWALVGALNGGEIPPKHKVVRDGCVVVESVA